MKLRDKNTPSYMKREILKAENKITKINSESAKAKQKSASKSKTKNVHTGHRERLKNQYFQNGIDTMTDIQQLELLLFYAIPQKDTNPIAHKLLEKFGNIKNVLNASVRDLCTVEGIKESSATFLKLVSQMTNVCSKPQERELIDSTMLAKEYCEKLYVGVNLEQFHVVCLSKDNKVIGTKMIKSGTTDEIKVEIRDITAFAISINCNRIVVSHNHPEGSGEMSDEDFKFTYSLVCSCMLNDIEILDHVIVGTDKCYSFAEHGLIEKLKNKAFKKVLIPKETQILLSNISKKYIISETFETNISTDNL